MKDTRIVLDDVRRKVPPGAKMLVAWIGPNGQLHAAQANMTQGDVGALSDALKASALTLPGGLLRAA